MDEAKRFMRYVLPGLVSILLIIVFHWATNPCTIKNLIRDYGADGNATTFGAAVLLFISSGALGYIFSTIYFLFSPCFMGLNHKPAIKTLLDLNYPLYFYDSRCGNEHHLNTNYITKQQALLIVNSWWWYLKGFDNGVKEIDKYLDRLSDAFHSLGATLTGSIISMSLVWLHYYQKEASSYHCVTKAIVTFDQAFIVWSILNLFFAINFFLSGNTFSDMPTLHLLQLLSVIDGSLKKPAFTKSSGDNMACQTTWLSVSRSDKKPPLSPLLNQYPPTPRGFLRLRHPDNKLSGPPGKRPGPRRTAHSFLYAAFSLSASLSPFVTRLLRRCAPRNDPGAPSPYPLPQGGRG